MIKRFDYVSVFHLSLDSEGTPPKPVMHIRSLTNMDFHFVPFGIIPRYDNNMNFELGSSNNDHKTWSLINTWLTQCLTSHDQCRRPEASVPYLPSRLIKLETPETFRLVQGTECPVGTRYVALSYCWGTKPVDSLLRLLQSTAKSLYMEQPVDILPKTFRHALEIIQRFEIRYIWIDRLCIFQDSAEDWQKEASTMQSVYRDAYIGISALGASDDDGGCFFERDPSKVTTTVVSFKLKEDGEEKAFRSDREKRWSWRHLFESEPVVQRSWVVQERLLAPRTLHFGSKQVFWECREASCSETQPQGVYEFVYEAEQDLNESNGDNETGGGDAGKATRHPMLWKQLLEISHRQYSSDPYEQLFIDWIAMAEYYASRELSVASDKLVALSGLANDMKSRLQQLRPGPHRYLAGLWEEKLIDTLLWRVWGPAARSSSYRAPTWSWACLDGDFCFLFFQDAIHFTSVVSVEMQHRGPDDTGEVEGGILTLLGPCVRIAIESFQIAGISGNRQGVRTIQMLDGQTIHVEEATLSRMEVFFDTMDDIEDEALFMFAVICHPTMERYYGAGLVLANAENDRYRRLGCMTCWFDSEEGARGFMNGVPNLQVTVI
ncbi:HET-domain-containing protein [Colletotrichum eremochloae]|nr:HET-domain-containing protein [Colletotrichum eremochloae]